MTWIGLALLSAASFGLVAVLDKRILSWHISSVSSYYMWLAASNILYALVAATFFGIPNSFDIPSIVAGYFSGFSWGLALACLFFVLMKEEVSRTIAIYHSAPVFVSFLAVIFLGESLGLGQWTGILLVVSGVFLVSIKPSPTKFLNAIKLKSLILIVVAAFMMGLAMFVSKIALEKLPVSDVYVMRNVGMAMALLLFAKPKVVRDALSVLRDRNTAILITIVLFILAPGSVLLTLLAIDQGPVSLVATITGTRPLFVFLFTAVLSISWIGFLDEPVQRSMILLKLCSITLIVVGIASLRII